MTSENYKNFAVASLNSTEDSDKVGLLIIAEAWLELTEQTTQLLGHEAEEAPQDDRTAANEGDSLTTSTGSGLVVKRGSTMSTAHDYQAMAEECFRRAQESQTDSERHGYLELARTWLEAASKMDCGPEILALPSCHWR